MTKVELTCALAEKLSGLPWEDIENSMEFYDEMIADRMEEGMSEEEAIAALGSVDEIAAQILSEIPLSRLVRAKVKSKRALRGWEIAMLILGAPLWLPLLIAAVAIILSVYVVLWSVVISFYAIALSLAVSAIACLLAMVPLLIMGGVAHGILCLGGALILAGMTVFGFYGCNRSAIGAIWLGKKMLFGIKSLFVSQSN